MSLQAFENTSTNVAAAQMRNALTNLAETVEDPNDKKVSYYLVERINRPNCHIGLQLTFSSSCQ